MRMLARLLVAFLQSLLAPFRAREEQVIVEMALRQQLSIYTQQQRRPRLSRLDRASWVTLSRFRPQYSSAISSRLIGEQQTADQAASCQRCRIGRVRGGRGASRSGRRQVSRPLRRDFPGPWNREGRLRMGIRGLSSGMAPQTRRGGRHGIREGHFATLSNLETFLGANRAQ